MNSFPVAKIHGKQTISDLPKELIATLTIATGNFNVLSHMEIIIRIGCQTITPLEPEILSDRHKYETYIIKIQI